MDDNIPIIKRRGPDNRTWYVVAEAMGSADAEIAGGLLRSAGIPVYFFREALGTALPLTVGLVGGVQVAVPEAFYADAMALLQGEQGELPAGDDDDLDGEFDAPGED